MDLNHYERPSIEVLGTLAEMTRGSTDGNLLDESFPINTPKSDLTFSG